MAQKTTGGRKRLTSLKKLFPFFQEAAIFVRLDCPQASSFYGELPSQVDGGHIDREHIHGDDQDHAGEETGERLLF